VPEIVPRAVEHPALHHTDRNRQRGTIRAVALIEHGAVRWGIDEHQTQRHACRTSVHPNLGASGLRLHARWREPRLVRRHRGGAGGRGLVQVKFGGEYLSGIEREQITGLMVPANVSRECWWFPDRCRESRIERL